MKLIQNYIQYPEMFDEMFDKKGITRDIYKNFEKFLSKTSVKNLNSMKDFAQQFFMNQGVTFTVYDDDQGVEKIFPFDIIPRIISYSDWKIIESGIKQRITALNLFIRDIYHEQFILNDNIIPAELIISNPNYLREMRNIKVPNDVYRHISGIDLIRNEEGKFFVLEDNLRTPSGVSYMLENREITRRLFPEMIPREKVQPISDYPNLLYNKLKSLSNKKNPVVVMLTPGLYNSAYYEHTALARLMGVELVEGSDLLVDNHYVFMKTAGGLKTVDIIYRRIDDDFLDPLNFKAESVLGIAGIMDSYRQGNVILVNSPGAGIADDKAIYTYVPEMISYYLNEKPILDNIKTYKLTNKDEKDYVLKNIDKLVLKRTDGSGGYGMLMGKSATKEEINKYKLKIEKEPEMYIAQPTLNLSTSPCLIENSLHPRCVDLRPFALFGSDGIEVCPGGLSRVALKKGSLIVNSSQGGGSKDTWIVKN